MSKWLLLLLGFVGGTIGWFMYKRMQPAYTDKIAPALIIIPGITGDLAKRKLVPALYKLYQKGLPIAIIGTGRRDADLRKLLQDARSFIGDVDPISWAAFSSHISYQKLDPQKPEDFSSLADTIAQIETNKLFGKRIVFLALPSDLFCPMTQHLVQTNIIARGKDHLIMYEKPLGWDLTSAQEINTCLTSLLPEKQLYYIDHYVAKELTQSLPKLPLMNPLLSSVWKGSSISCVSILFHEKIDIEGRGQFYDKYGAIKDVIQNHVLQLLAFFAVDLSRVKNQDDLIHQKISFLNSLRVRTVERGQYEGYTAEYGVASSSRTETYATITLESSDPRWKGTTFFLEAGKALAEKSTQMRVEFKKGNATNELVIQFSPHETLSLSLNGLEPEPIKLATSLDYPEAYEALLADALSDKKLRVSFQEIEAQWKLTDAMLKHPTPLKTYAKGTKDLGSRSMAFAAPL